MNVSIRIAVVILGLLAPGVVRADHDHGGMAAMATEEVASKFSAGVGLVAARYDTNTYGGDYQGFVPGFTWMRGRFGAMASLGVYRLTENGAERYGVGDAMVSGHVMLVEHGATMAGVALPVSLPSGDHLTGFGMGHVMLMPSAWGSTELGTIRFGASLGYSRALGAGATHHDHGSWPLIDPMNMEEISWSASANVPLGRVIRAGVRMAGGVALGDMGHTRVTGGVRATWTEGQVETGFEIQAGFAGDPFILRGLLESAVHF